MTMRRATTVSRGDCDEDDDNVVVDDDDDDDY